MPRARHVLPVPAGQNQTAASIIHPVTSAQVPHSGIDCLAAVELSAQPAGSFEAESVMTSTFAWPDCEQTGKYHTCGVILSACVWIFVVSAERRWVGLIATCVADGLLSAGLLMMASIVSVQLIGRCLTVFLAHPPARPLERRTRRGRIVLRGGGFLVQKNFDVCVPPPLAANACGYIVQKITKTHSIRHCTTHAPRFARDASYYELFPVFAQRNGRLAAASADMFSADNHLPTTLFAVAFYFRLLVKYLFCQRGVVTQDRVLRDWWTDNSYYGAIQIDGLSWFWPLDEDCVRKCEAGDLSVMDVTGQAYSMTRVPEANGLLASPYPPRDLVLPPDDVAQHSVTLIWNSDLQHPNQILLPSGRTHVIPPGNDFSTLIEHGI